MQPLPETLPAQAGIPGIPGARHWGDMHPSGFDTLMPKTLATATVDRLLHHAHVCQTTGESVRLSQALAGQGVSPLT
mgnify:CR=1 FL=1